MKSKISITNEEVSALAGLSVVLRDEYLEPAEDKWAGSPFAWIRTRPSRQIGTIGERLVEAWCKTKDLHVSRSPDSDADRLIEGRRVEIKLSTLWKTDVYKFQQIRDQNYEYLFCVGISPFAVHAWIVRKDMIPFEELEHQHGGKRGSDTWWIGFRPDNPPGWLKKTQSGKLEDVYKVLEKLKKK